MKNNIGRVLITIIIMLVGISITPSKISAETLGDKLVQDVGMEAVEIYNRGDFGNITNEEIEILIDSMGRMIQRIEETIQEYDERGWTTEDGLPIDPLNVYHYRWSVIELRETQIMMIYFYQIAATFSRTIGEVEYNHYLELLNRYVDTTYINVETSEEFIQTIEEWAEVIPKEELYWEIEMIPDLFLEDYLEVVADTFEDRYEILATSLEMKGMDEQMIGQAMSQFIATEREDQEKFGRMGKDKVLYYEIIKQGQRPEYVRNVYDEFVSITALMLEELYAMNDKPNTVEHKQKMILEYAMSIEKAEFIHNHYGKDIAEQLGLDVDYFSRHLTYCNDSFYNESILQINGGEGACRR